MVSLISVFAKTLFSKINWPMVICFLLAGVLIYSYLSALQRAEQLKGELGVAKSDIKAWKRAHEAQKAEIAELERYRKLDSVVIQALARKLKSNFDKSTEVTEKQRELESNDESVTPFLNNRTPDGLRSLLDDEDGIPSASSGIQTCHSPGSSSSILRESCIGSERGYASNYLQQTQLPISVLGMPDSAKMSSRLVF